MAKVLVAVETAGTEQCGTCRYREDETYGDNCHLDYAVQLCGEGFPDYCPIHGKHRHDALRDALLDFVTYMDVAWGRYPPSPTDKTRWVPLYLDARKAGTWPPK